MLLQRRRTPDSQCKVRLHDALYIWWSQNQSHLRFFLIETHSPGPIFIIQPLQDALTTYDIEPENTRIPILPWTRFTQPLISGIRAHPGATTVHYCFLKSLDARLGISSVEELSLSKNGGSIKITPAYGNVWRNFVVPILIQYGESRMNNISNISQLTPLLFLSSVQ